jgi:hypothetical protein
MRRLHLALSLALPAFLLAPGAAAAEVAFGVNGHPFTAYPGISLEAQLDLVEDLGASSYRVNVSDIDQADALETLIAGAAARGITILPVLTPVLDFDALDDAALHDAAYAFGEAFAERFASDVPVFELGNEMENYALIEPCEMRDDGSQYPCEWGTAGGVEPLDYYGPRYAEVAAVLRGLSEGVKSAAPESRRAIGTAGWGHTGFFERLQADGIEWDITVWHMYGEDPQWALDILRCYGHPIWITEFNHSGGSAGGDEAQRDGLVDAIRRIRVLAGRYDIEAAHIYELLDEPYWAPGLEASMGLVQLLPAADDAWTIGPLKPAFAAVRDLISTPSGNPPATPNR